jgi:N-methylhydantoinase A
MWVIEVALGDRGEIAGAEDVATLKRVFDANHQALFSMSQPDSAIEVITWRGEARVVRPKPRLTADGRSNGTALGEAIPTSTRQAFFDGTSMETAIYRGEDLAPGMSITSPAIIEEPTTTIVLIPGSRCLVRPSHYLIEIDHGH